MAKKLKDCCAFQEGYVNPSQKVRSYFGGDIKWLRAVDLNGADVYTTSQTLTREGFESAGKSAFLFPKDSIAISKSGSIGELGILRDEMCGNRAVINIDVQDNADLKYIFYLLQFKKPEIIKRAVGSIQKNLYVSELGEVELCHDSLADQQAISSVLGAIDDKIANNKKLMAELEATARLIYDYYFTQFDFPNDAGKPYRASGGQMVYNETLHRDIPLGWEVEKLGDVCESRLGGTPDTTIPEYWGGKMPWLNSAEVATSPILYAEKTISNLGQSESATAFAPAGSVLLSITRYIRPSILAIDSCFNQSVIAILESGSLKLAYLYPFIQTQVPRYMGLRTGAQQPHINKNIVDGTLMVVPDKTVLQHYYQVAAPLFNQQIDAAKQNYELERLRDWLLPMLMNGQVSVAS